MAFATDRGRGDEVFEAAVLDIGTQQAVPCHLERVGSLEWLPGGPPTLVYTHAPAGNSPRVPTQARHRLLTMQDPPTWFHEQCVLQVRAHELGSKPSRGDPLLFQEPDRSRFLQLTRTRDGAFVLINSNSKGSSEVLLVDRAPGNSCIRTRLVAPRAPGLEYFVEHNRGSLYLLTNAPEVAGGRGGGAREYSLARASVDGALGPESWELLLEPRQGRHLGFA